MSKRKELHKRLIKTYGERPNEDLRNIINRLFYENRLRKDTTVIDGFKTNKKLNKQDKRFFRNFLKKMKEVE